MSQQDVVMQQIVESVELGRAGDREAARTALARIWDGLGARPDPLHAVTLAHFMADLQDDPADELAWDRRALDAADGLTDARAQAYDHTLAVRALYPSLFASLAADHAGLDEVETAREYLTRAEAALPGLADGEYGDLVRTEITRLRDRIGPGSGRADD